MNDISSPGSDAKSGLQIFNRLEALQILPLPIWRKNGEVVDVEHSSNAEFTAWLRWNGIPFTGPEEWTFDSKCAIINHVLRQGFKPRLIATPTNVFGMSLESVSNVFDCPKSED